jgi:polyhydroxybutyrate depolymerase
MIPRFLPVLVTTHALALTACVGAGALPGASAKPVPAISSAAVSSAASCVGRARQPTNATWTLDFGGRTRTFVVHVPPSYDPSMPTPLVFNFHGYRMSPKLEEWLTSMSATADAAGFVLVYPEGTGSPLGFNAGGCCGDAKDDHVDDVGFTRAMLDRLEADLCVDPQRVFATGMSNGGFMSHRLACEMSDRIAAVAPVSGVNATATCAPTRAVPILDFHGVADPTVPYYGGSSYGWPSVNESINAWAARDGCSGPTLVTSVTDDVHCVTHTQCRRGRALHDPRWRSHVAGRSRRAVHSRAGEDDARDTSERSDLGVLSEAPAPDACGALTSSRGFRRARARLRRR